MSLDGKTVLITGGTGSFGHAALQRFLKIGAAQIRIFSRDEKKQDDMRRFIDDDRVKFYLGDVRDESSVRAAMVGAHFVFHAAALKQVPSCEFFPMEAVRTNVIGTENVLNAAVLSGVERIVCLSTDKAAYPINAMGISKAMMEKIVIAKSRTANSDLTISLTRYGNVMASRGSVIPLFIEQIKQNRPLTITDPEMTRFLMSLDEAVELVDFAFKHARQGELFVQKSPAASVGDLATALKELFDSEVPVQIIGTRHGEKAYETLLTREERARATEDGDFFRVEPDGRELNYKEFVEAGSNAVETSSEYNSENTNRLNIDSIKQKLAESEYVRMELARHRGEIG
jgi:UDP-glucose 4-epimerase